MKNHPNTPDLEKSTRTLLLAAMLTKGWKLPTTAEEIKFVDSLSVEPIEIPNSLKSASAVFEEIMRPRSEPVARLTVDASDSCDNLALAAREGGVISESIRALMDLDRANAEGNAIDDTKPK